MKHRQSLCAAMVCALGLVSGPARADAVDEAVARGRSAAAATKWSAAISAYEEAQRVLPGRSAALALELGTAYAQVGRYGEATLQLSRVLRDELAASPPVVEAARHNLGVIRGQMERSAKDKDLRLSRADDGWDLTVALFSSPVLAWLACLAGVVAGLLALGLRFLGGRASAGMRSAAWGLVLASSAAWLLLGAAHGLARATQGLGTWVVVAPEAALYEGPGTHRPRLFGVQPGAKVVVLETTSGWLRVRLVGGPQGWLARDHALALDGGDVSSESHG